MPEFRTDFQLSSSGLLVPPAFAKAAQDERRRLDGRFFALQSKTGKHFTSMGAWGGATTAGAMEKPRDTVAFSQLRAEFGGSPIDKLIVQARLHQMRYVSRKVLVPERETGWRVVHQRSADPNFENTPAIERRCREVEQIVERVNPKVVPGGFRSFLNLATRDELVFDRKVMIIARDREGLPAAYWTADPTSIKPRIQVLAPWMQKNNFPVGRMQEAAERFSQDLANKGARDQSGGFIDLSNAAYVQEIEGQVVAAWEDHEIDVDITNITNEVDHYFYGRSIFEDSLDVSRAFLAAFKYNTGWFNSKVPEQLIYLAGDVDPEGYDAFQKQILQQGAPADFHRVAFISGAKEFDVRAFPMRSSLRDMAFAGWIRLLIAMKCGYYRMDPRIINFDLATGNDQNFFKTSSREMQIALSQEEGFHTIIMNMEAWLNRTIVQPRYPDLMLRWVGLDRPSEQDRVQLLATKLASYASFDDIRNETGVLPPLAVPGYPDLGKLPANPVLLGMMNYLDQRRLQYQQDAQQRQAQQYAAGGGGMAPTSPDTSSAPASAGSQPGAGAQPATGGDVERQSAGMAGLQKAYTIRIDRAFLPEAVH